MAPQAIEVIFKTTRRARIDISPTMLKQALGLPIDAIIHDVIFKNDPNETITIVVEHCELSEVEEGAYAPKVKHAVSYAELREFVKWL